MQRCLTVIFAKAPEPGRVKTRLCPPLVAKQAAELAECMLLDLLGRLRSYLGSDDPFGLRAEPSNDWSSGPSLSTEASLGVAFAPEQARPWFEEHCAGAQLWPQIGDGLGERLAHFFEQRFEEGWSSVVVLGSDSPLCPMSRLAEAHRRLLGDQELVLGPDAGGGYDLIGLSRPEGRLFRQVEMSTADMCTQTLHLAEQLELNTYRLPSWFDVDTAADLARIQSSLAKLDPQTSDWPARTAAWLEGNRELIP